MRHAEVIGVVEDEQPALVSAKPALNGFHRDHLILNVGCWQLQKTRYCHIAREQCIPRIGSGPKGVGVFRQVPMGIFQGGLGFANTAQTA